MLRALPVIVTACLAGTPASAPPPVVALVLNHLDIELDSATYHDVRASPFVQQDFAAVDSTDPSAGVRLTGKYNWIALHPPAAGQPPGDVAVTLGVGGRGALEALVHQGSTMRVRPADTTAPAHPDFRSDLILVARLAGQDSTSAQARFDVMTYTAAAAQLLGVHDSLPATDLTAARFLAPYYDRHRLLEYVSAATLAIPVDDIAKITRVLRRDSVPVFPEGQGAVIRLDGFTLHLIPPWAGAGVKQLQFALTRELLGNPTYRFGPTSQLRFGPGPTAVWDFGNR